MAIAEDLVLLERSLTELITRYEQYFSGLEKREPLKLLQDVEKMVRRYTGVPINNTMYKHKYTMLVARLNTYREYWNRILRMIEEGKYSRDRFISDLRQRHRSQGERFKEDVASPPKQDTELERIYYELREARKACHLPIEMLTRELVAATLEKSKNQMIAKLGTDNITFRVVVENGKPKIKASQRK
jgi:hypothetical protein